MWNRGEFLIATMTGPEKMIGHVHDKGCLGMYRFFKASPKGRRPPTWSITHLGSGHALCHARMTFEAACFLGDQIADMADWSFDGLYGWKNMDPDLPEKFKAFIASHGESVYRGGYGSSQEEVARQIVAARLG